MNTITLTGVAVNAKPRMAPTAPSGTVNMMMNGWTSDSNWAAMTR